MKRISIGALAAVLAISLAGCEGMGPKQQTGTAIGGILGGIGGAQIGRGHGRTAAIIAGTLLGALIGSEIGRAIDTTDELKAQRALEYNRDHEPARWHNPNTGADVVVIPERTYQTASGTYCREYQMEVIVGGKRQQAYGTACRQPDGSWKIIN
ncbi:MAG: glycine zipper 2TM domain-containing protein [Gammaproteobacteria bacterium]|nr:MAG: glycine zipper 2TM domain-containing protein [Gammaproteobacteria bacterium]